MDKIRIGVMGCASIAGRSMIPAIKKLSEQYVLVGIASRDPKKAELWGHRFDCEAIYGYDALIAREDIDAIYMPLPTGLHAEWIMKSLKAGKHVYAEKSIALSYADSELFVNTAKDAGLVLMEGYMFLYHSQQQRILELIDSGAIGEIRHFCASFGFPPLDADNFRYDKNIGGGAIMDCAGYVIRAASLLLRQRLTVQAASVKLDDNGTSNYGTAFLVAQDNTPVSVSFGFDNFYQCRYDIWGSKGKLSALKAFTPKEKESPIIQLETSTGVKQIVCDADNHFEKAMIEFRNSILLNNSMKHYFEILEQSRLLDELITHKYYK